MRAPSSPAAFQHTALNRPCDRTFFFVTIVVMAGNGHFQSQTPDGPVPCRVKPNTTGMDFLLARVMEIWNALYDKLMIPPKDRHNLILNCMRYTSTVWENLVTAQAAAGRLVAVPPPDANFQAMSLTEIRDSLKSLIQYGPPRNEQVGQTVSFNSQEVNTTRVASTKRKLGNNNIVVLASNVGSKNAEQKEEGNTLDVVCHVLTAGVPPPTAKRMRTELNDTETNANTARNQPLENQDIAVNCIAYTSNFAGLYVGLLNHIGAFAAEVNPVVGAFLDWGFFYIKQYASSSMDVFVRDNFSRMREGYKSRGVVLTIWLKVMHTLSLGKPKDETVQHIWMDIHTDALAMCFTPIVFCNLLCRGVHMGSLIMANVIATHLRCPVVDIRNLNAFFDMTAPPADLEAMEAGLRDDYVRIRDFIHHCFLNYRFCPPEDSPICNLSNISCYISGDATQDLLPVNPKLSLLRVPLGKDKDENHDISHKVALRIASQFGEELFGQCHMGPEVSTYRLALVYLTERFAPDFRGLMSPNMFSSRQHLLALGLERHAPGMPDYVDHAHPPFARQFNIRAREQVQSQAIGVNVWSLLTVVSLIGSTDIHPDVSNAFANSLTEIILSHAPPAATPGNICPTPRFGQSGQSVKLFVPDIRERPKHFLRPNEPSFVRNGILPIAKAVGRFAPEDLLHAPQLSAVCKQLHCDIMEVPANAFTVIADPSPHALSCRLLTPSSAVPVLPHAGRGLHLPRARATPRRAGHVRRGPRGSRHGGCGRGDICRGHGRPGPPRVPRLHGVGGGDTGERDSHHAPARQGRRRRGVCGGGRRDRGGDASHRVPRAAAGQRGPSPRPSRLHVSRPAGRGYEDRADLLLGSPARKPAARRRGPLFGHAGPGGAPLPRPGQGGQAAVHPPGRPARPLPRGRQALRHMPPPAARLARPVHARRGGHHPRREPLGRAAGSHVHGGPSKCGQAFVLVIKSDARGRRA